jgi:transcriptional regulator with XRE-family HTH domain
LVDDLAVAFGAAVRTLRIQRGWTQDDLADAAGLQPTYVSDVERGERRPGLPNQGRLAAALGVKLWELIRLAEEGDNPGG